MFVKRFILTCLIDYVYSKVYINMVNRLCLLKGLFKKLKVGCMYAATFGCMYAPFGCMSMERLGACMRLLGASLWRLLGACLCLLGACLWIGWVHA